MSSILARSVARSAPPVAPGICSVPRVPLSLLIEGGVKSYLRKEEVPFTPAMVDAHNAEHAAEYASVSRDEAVRRLEDSIAKMVQTVRSLSDDELGITMPLLLVGGAPTSTAGLIKIVTDHVRLHLPSAQRALSG